MAFHFDVFSLDEDRRQVLRGTEPVPLEPKAFELLRLLVTRRPKALSKAQIRDVLWPGTVVSESTLVGLVADVRAALGDSAQQPRFIRTVHGFGYAFFGTAESDVAMAKPAASGAVFKLFWDDREIALQEGENILGRDKDAVAWIDYPSVSRHHARILISGGEAVLEDLGSRNGTMLGGQRITSRRTLSDGDKILIGSARLTFRRYLGGVTTRSTRAH